MDFLFSFLFSSLIIIIFVTVSDGLASRSCF